jgi:putative transposase
VRYAFVERHRGTWPIVVQCRVLQVSASGYHQFRLRQAAEIGPNQPHRRLSNTALAVHIKAVFAEIKGADGWPRIWRELAARGIRAGKERVRRMMKACGLRARGKRRFKATTNSAHDLPVARTCWRATSPWMHRTGSGQVTSPISGPRRAGSTLPL